MLTDATRIVEEGHLGIRTYDEFIAKCQKLCAAGDRDAVSLFVLAGIVQPFCDYYRDQPLSQPDAIEFRKRLLSHIGTITAATTADARETALGEVIRRETSASVK